MPKYNSEEEFRIAVKNKIGLSIPETLWKSTVDWDPPYDSGDLREVIKLLIPELKVKQQSSNNDFLRAAFVRCQLIPPSIKEKVENIRLELFGTSAPPFNDIKSMTEWAVEESRSQPPTTGHAPDDGYYFDFSSISSDIVVDTIKKLNQENPGIYGVKYDGLAIPSESGSTGYVIVSEGTRLRRLWLHVRNLAKELDCQEAQATAFILIGLIPITLPIETKITRLFGNTRYNRGVITITIHEPISEDELIKRYRGARRKLWGKNRDPQIPSERDCELVKFVLPLLDSSNPTWEILRKEWNSQYPNWSFGYWQGFRVAYKRAEKKIFPEIRFGP